MSGMLTYLEMKEELATAYTDFYHHCLTDIRYKGGLNSNLLRRSQ